MTSPVKLPITSDRGVLRSTSSYPENHLHHFTTTAKFIAGLRDFKKFRHFLSGRKAGSECIEDGRERSKFGSVARASSSSQQILSYSLNPWYFTAAISKKPIPLKWGGIRMMSHSPSLRTLCDYPLFGKCLNSFLIPWFQVTFLVTSSYIHPPVLDKLLSTEFSTLLGTPAGPSIPLVQKPHWRIWWNWRWCVTHRSRLFCPLLAFFETSV